MSVSSKEYKINFEVIKSLNEGKEMPAQPVQASQSQTFLDAILAARIEIDHTCGGMGTCGTCRVFVKKGIEKFPIPNEVEQEIINERVFQKNERLCCQNEVISGVILKIPYSI